MPKQLTKSKSAKIDKRTKNGKKLDIRQVIKLREVNGLSNAEVAKTLGFSEPYIHKSYREFKKLLPDTEIAETFDANRVNLLSGIEYKMLQNLAKADKLKKASLNNVAYAFNQIHTARRLEEGKGTAGGVTVNIELAFQDATSAAKALRLKHAGSGTTVDISSSDPED